MKRNPSLRKLSARHIPALAARQKGFTLIELSIALAIVSVLIVGSLIGVQRILANNRANNLLAEVPRINAALVGAAVNSSNFASITTKKAAALGAFSPNTVKWENDTPTVSNAFGGSLYIQGNDSNMDGVGGKDRGYIVVATGIPTDMCATVVNGLAPLAQVLWVEAPATQATPANFDQPVTSAPAVTDMIKGPDATSAINIDKLAERCRGGNSNTRVVYAFVPL